MKFFTLTLYLLLYGVLFQSSIGFQNINIGLIVDVGSQEGEIVESCMAMAISDFYNLNEQYETRVALQVRDYGGDSFRSIISALDLLENLEVHAILVPKISEEDLFLAQLGDFANVPLLSFSSISSASEHPYFLQVAEDETTQFYGIAALVEAFNWTSCVVLYEDSGDARKVQSYLYNILQENHVDVVHQVAISLNSTDDQIIGELKKLVKMRTSIYIVHMPPSLASEVLITAKKLGIVRKGFAWIITSKTMNFLESLNSSVRDSMQGALGLKPCIPASGRLQDFTLRWRRESQLSYSNMETGDLNVFCLWAYDAVWALAEAVERIGIKPSKYQGQGNWSDLAHLRVSGSGPALLSEITSSKFVGLVGDFHILNRKLIHDSYEIVNMIGKSDTRVGFWTSANGLSKDLNSPKMSSSNNTLETIIWPGFSTTVPESWLVQMNGKKFKVGIPPGYMPELVNITEDLQKNITTYSGFCVDVFQAAVDRLPYQISYEFIPFYNRSYTNLIHEVYLQTYDIVVGDITILANRSAYVDFTLPYTESGPAIIAKLDDKDPWFFLKPFDSFVWVLSLCSFVVMGFVVWLIEHPTNDEFQGSLAWKIGTVLWFSNSTLVYAHRENLKKNLSRFVVGIWLFVVFMLTSMYTANLSSLLTVRQIKLSNGDYYGSANSLVQGLTVNNLNFRDHRLKPFQSTEQYDEALTKGSKNGGVGAIIEEIPYIKILLSKYPNKYTMIESSMRTSGFGFAFTKGSPLVHEVSRAIAELREEGSLSELEKKWFKARSPLISEDTQQIRPNALGIQNIYGLFVIAGVSKFIAIFIFLVLLIRRRLSNIFLIARVLVHGNFRLILRYLSPRFYGHLW